MSVLVHSAMTVHGAFRVELLVALFICSRAAVAPNLLALDVQCWAHSVETVACV